MNPFYSKKKENGEKQKQPKKSLLVTIYFEL